MKSFIYALLCPDRKVRYIGKTNSPKRRMYDHITAGESSHAGKWVANLMAQGLMPSMDILDETEDEWGSLERYWIAFFRSTGCNLLNRERGGPSTAIQFRNWDKPRPAKGKKVKAHELSWSETVGLGVKGNRNTGVRAGKVTEERAKRMELALIELRASQINNKIKRSKAGSVTNEELQEIM